MSSRGEDPEPQVVAVVGSKKAVRALQKAGYESTPLDRVEDAYNTATMHRERAIVVAGRALKKQGGERVIAELRRHRPLTDVIVWAPLGDAEKVRAALRGGAREVVLSESTAELAEKVREIVDEQLFLPQLQKLRHSRKRRHTFEGLVSRSPEMWDLFETCVRVAPTAASVLVLGETGTGKELLARAVHRRSERKGRFVAVNCAAIPEGLVDAELFGHEKGTFTGAVRAKAGLFRHADGGTLFLDEIGNVPPAVQFSLLRVLQEEKVRPVGGHEEIPVDVRVIAATSQPLEEAVERGDFREDLLYRLDVIRLSLPPLRDRTGDLIFLFHHFVKKFCKVYKLPRPSVLESFLDAVTDYDWPGNVRQLENLTERLVLTHSGEALRAGHFLELSRSGARETALQRHAPPRVASIAEPSRRPGPKVDLDTTLAENVARAVEPVERTYLEGLLRRYRGRVGLTAEHADVNRRTILRKMKQLGLDKADFRDG